MILLTWTVGLPILIALYFWQQHRQAERIRRHLEHLDSLRPWQHVVKATDFDNMVTQIIHLDDIHR